MAAHAIAATNLWLDGEDWSWPAARPDRLELGPPAWIPAVPLRGSASGPVVDRPGAGMTRAGMTSPRPGRREASAVAAPRFTIAPAGAIAPPRRRSMRWRVAGQRLAACVALAAVFAATFELAGRLQPDARSATAAGAASTARAGAAAAAPLSPNPPVATAASDPVSSSDPVLSLLSRDASGASIAAVRYTSSALHRRASFLAYLPPGYRAGGSERYPVLYLLHGDGQLADSALQFGLTSTLDALIDNGEIHPLIVVIPQGARYTYNWRDVASMHYEDYVLETQQLADRLLPTVADRAGRAIAGFSMGGFGAMNIALGHLDRFSVVESWLGFFNGLGGELRADAPSLRRMPLTAFVYGGADDTIADPSENAPFAAALRDAGASAASAVYPGGHDFATLRAHLRHMLVFAGHALANTSA